MTDKIIVLTTCGSADEAKRIARALVESRLAACVAMTPKTQTVYHWDGAIEESEEWALTIKSRRDLFATLSAEVVRLHSYKTPELLAIPIAEGGAAYLQWMDGELGPAVEE